MKFFLFLLVILISSCKEKNHNSQEDELIGTKINLMKHAVKPHNADSTQVPPDFNNTFKIVTYTDLYCYPCWQSVLPWKTHLNDFKQYSNVSFFCYVNASQNDFDAENEKARLNFPVFLDFQGRFRVVNKIGNDPDRLTFLLNKENEIIIVGPPFTKEIKQKYIDDITNTKLD